MLKDGILQSSEHHQLKIKPCFTLGKQPHKIKEVPKIHNVLKTEGYVNSVFKNTKTTLCALKVSFPKLLITDRELSTPFYIT